MGKTTGVKCTVDECVYWGSGDVCEADAIEVNRNPAHRGAARGAGMEIGRIGERAAARGAVKGADTETGRLGERGEGLGEGRPAAIASEHTMCKTFKPKTAGYTR